MVLSESRSQGCLEGSGTLEEELAQGTIWLGLSAESWNSEVAAQSELGLRQEFPRGSEEHRGKSVSSRNWEHAGDAATDKMLPEAVRGEKYPDGSFNIASQKPLSRGAWEL